MFTAHGLFSLLSGLVRRCLPRATPSAHRNVDVNVCVCVCGGGGVSRAAARADEKLPSPAAAGEFEISGSAVSPVHRA